MAEITLAGGVSCDTASPTLRNPYVEEQWKDRGGEPCGLLFLPKATSNLLKKTLMALK